MEYANNCPVTSNNPPKAGGALWLPPLVSFKREKLVKLLRLDTQKLLFWVSFEKPETWFNCFTCIYDNYILVYMIIYGCIYIIIYIFAVECDSDIFVLIFQLLLYNVYYPVN